MRKIKRLLAVIIAALSVTALVFFSAKAAETAAEENISAVKSADTIELTLSSSELEMGVLESYTLTVKKPVKNVTYTFSSSNTFVAAVSKKGKITALKKGSALISVRGSDGTQGKCSVTVLSAPESITLNKKEITLGEGERFRFGVSFSEGSASATLKSYFSQSGILEDCGNGTVRALKQGKVKVTVKAFNGKKATCTVTVLSAPEKITLNKNTVTLGLGESFDFNSKLPDGSASQKRKYTASENGVLSYEGSGVFRAVRKGTATVTVETYNGKKATCQVKVLSAPLRLSLNKTELVLGKGEGFTFKPSVNENAASETVKYTSSDPTVLKIKSSGAVKALKKGTVTVTAETYNGKKAKCTVTVRPAPKSVTLNKTEITLGVGESFDFNSSVPKGTASYLRKFTAKDTSLLDHQGSGVFLALKKGKTTVSVETFNGKKAKCTVTVLPAPESITLNKTKLTLAVGDSFDFDSYVSKGSASYKRSYSVSGKSILSVDSSGVVTALKKGKATVTVKTFNGKKAKCTVTVTAVPSAIYADKSSYTLAIGGKTKALFSFPGKVVYNNLTYKSSNKSVAYCDSEGFIRANKMGSAVITAALPNGKSCSFTVNVKAMSVPFVSQLPSYPTGCEAASCASIMKYYGYSITLDQMVDTIPSMSIYVKDGKRWGPDINEYFVGNPRGSYTSADAGYGAFSPCVTKALQAAVDARKGSHKAVMLTGCSFSELLKEISAGRPAIVWATYMMQIPKTVNSWYIIGTGEYFEYPRGTHVMVVNGYSDDRIYIVDPYKGQVDFSISTFEARWNLLGKQAIVLK